MFVHSVDILMRGPETDGEMGEESAGLEPSSCTSIDCVWFDLHLNQQQNDRTQSVRVVSPMDCVLLQVDIKGRWRYSPLAGVIKKHCKHLRVSRSGVCTVRESARAGMFGGAFQTREWK